MRVAGQLLKEASDAVNAVGYEVYDTKTDALVDAVHRVEETNGIRVDNIKTAPELLKLSVLAIFQEGIYAGHELSDVVTLPKVKDTARYSARLLAGTYKLVNGEKVYSPWSAVKIAKVK